MPAKFAWFERRFDFNFPAAKYPDIVERLRGTPVRVEEMIKSVPVQLLTRCAGDTWSVQENVGHLLDVEPLWSGRVDDVLADLAVMRAADLANNKTREANHNSALIDTITGFFRAARLRFVSRLDGFDEQTFARSSGHPRLRTPMRLVDLCLFVAEHDDYHLARITELTGLFTRECGGDRTSP